MSKLMMGHRVHGEVFEFPHVCPGENCAIEEWLNSHSALPAPYFDPVAAKRSLARVDKGVKMNKWKVVTEASLATVTRTYLVESEDEPNDVDALHGAIFTS